MFVFVLMVVFFLVLVLCLVVGFDLVNLDTRVDLPVEPIASEETDGAGDKEKCERDDGHVA